MDITPDFQSIELLSPRDKLEKTQAKMREYLDNGMILGWPIDCQDKQVELYQQGQAVEVINSPNSLSSGDILPGFVLDLYRIYDLLNDGKTKLEYARDMLQCAVYQKQLPFQGVLMDTWYATKIILA